MEPKRFQNGSKGQAEDISHIFGAKTPFSPSFLPTSVDGVLHPPNIITIITAPAFFTF